VVSLPASNDQAVGKIAELLGLGVGQYLNKKKIQMLGNPVDYLTRRNNGLAAIGTTTTDTYNTKLDDLVDSIAGPALVVGAGVTQGHVDAWDAECLAVHGSSNSLQVLWPRCRWQMWRW